MDALVNPKETEKVSGRFVGGGTAFPFPKGGAEIVAFG
jgi:hypothetical protein